MSAGPELAPAELLSRAIGPWPSYCAGYQPAAGGAYVAAPAVTAVTRQVNRRLSEDGDDAVTIDLALEVLGMAQVNSMPVHRFCGPAGLLAGIDLLRPASPPARLTTLVPDSGGASVPVFYLDPVAEAAAGLLGTFPILAGEHTACVQAHRPVLGPAVAGAVLAIGVPEDRRRDAAVFMGSLIADSKASAADLPAGPLGTADLADRAEQAAWSVLAAGEMAGRRYREIYAGAAAVPVLPGWKGTGLVAVPCLRLAVSAVPVPPDLMLEMTLPAWLAMYR